MLLHVHEWGDPGAPPVVCLHGVQGHGRRFRKLAEERLAPAGFRVYAFDLRGHGRSSWDPPWSITTHVDDLVETARSLGVEEAIWIGHSFGGRLVLELLDETLRLVRRAVLLDPALRVPPARALDRAEGQRPDRSFATFEEALADGRADSTRAPREILEEELHEHLVEGPDGRLRFRYLPSAVATAYGELATPAPQGAAVPTLLVVAEETDVTRPEDVEQLRARLGDFMEIVTVPGGHIVLWDAFEETAAAIERFLSD